MTRLRFLILLTLVSFLITITETQLTDSFAFSDVKDNLFGQTDLTDIEEKRLSDHERLILKQLITNITDIFKPIMTLLSDNTKNYSPKEIYNIIEFAHLQQQNFRDKFMIPQM